MSKDAAARMPLGPVMVDVAGLALDDADRTRLLHPMVGAVILFARNFASPGQLLELTAQIRALRKPELLVAVDHEGGRVQRFRDGFTRLPAMGRLGVLWATDATRACATANAAGYVMARELIAHGVDFSFAPVLDVDFGRSGVIGDRAFSPVPEVIAALSAALVAGMRQGGMASTGKHFPGHGHVQADSHVAVPVDPRKRADIEADLLPFRRLVALGMDAIMPAHVIYPELDSSPAGFSAFWLGKVLRKELRFDGVIFSDDLSMEGASVAGDVLGRAEAAFTAGCDMVLVCNQPAMADQLLAGMPTRAFKPARARRMRARPVRGMLSRDKRYAASRALLAALDS